MKSNHILPGDFIVAVSDAVQVGKSDRQAATHSRAHHEAHLISTERLDAAAEARFLSVVGDIPNKVLQAVGCSMTWDQDIVVPVMELSHKEYPGPQMRSPFQQPEETLDVALLAHAAPAVFRFLEHAGQKPRLKYVYNGDIRRYSLQIAIEVHPGTCPRLDK
jgi:hypothetical protein